MLKKNHLIWLILILSLFIAVYTGCREGTNQMGQMNVTPDNDADTPVTSTPAEIPENTGTEEPEYDVSSLPDNNTNYNFSIDDPLVKEKLKETGFVVVPNKDRMALYEVYNYCKYDGTPVFVTSDSILHTSHLIFDWYLRYLEIAHLKGDLTNLTDGLLAKTMEYYDTAEDEKIKEAALKNALYFTVAKQLLSGGDMAEVPENLSETIKKEIELIESHEGFSDSPLMGYKEDYSQYVPRGHYNRSPEFQQYFKAMIWYGRIYFPADNDTNTLQAILICKAMEETEVKGETAGGVWERIYETTAFFSGKADDLLYKEYKEAINKTYGEKAEIKDFSDTDKLVKFKEEINSLEKPKILSTMTSDTENQEEGWADRFQGFRFMGQRFTFDGYIFQNLVYDAVGEYKGEEPLPFTEGAGVRAFARGLDVMAVLGSEEAEKILKEEGDTNFAGYEEQFNKLKEEAGQEKNKGWLRDLYNGRLWILQDILKAPDKNVPEFMKTKEWKLKQLNTALGSWTELKHDTILYSKQPYTCEQRALSTYSKGGEPEPTPAIVKGYVEPSVEIYQRTKLIMQKLKEKITELGFPEDAALIGNLSSFEALLATLEEISIKELAGEALTQEEYQAIENIGSRLESSLSFGHYFDVSPDFYTEEDDKMPVIADVLTDVNTKEVLEVATGTPFIIFAEVEIDKEVKICKGAVYSSFEFKWPMDDRLTDEAWRTMLENNKEPQLPAWTSGFTVIKN